MSPVAVCNQLVDSPVRFRRQIPYAALDDLRLGLPEIAYLCLVAAQREGFIPSEIWVRDQIGMGKPLQQKVVRILKQTGYLERHQPAPGQRLEQRLVLNAAPHGRAGFLIAFDPLPDMGWRAYAMHCWMRTHRAGFEAETWRVAERFDTCSKTINRIMDVLRKRELAEGTLLRGDNGRLTGKAYRLPDGSAKRHQDAPDAPDTHHEDKNGEHKNHEHKNRVHTNKQAPLTASPNQSPLPTNTTPPGDYSPPGGGKRSRQRDFIDLGLGQLDGSALIDECFPQDWRQDVVRPYLPDRQLRQAIRVATQGRIHDGLLSSEGLESARAMIAGLVYGGPHEDLPDWPQGELAERIRSAASVFLRALEDRIGRRPGEWLNSWALISSRLAGYLFGGGGGRVFAEPQVEA